MTVLMVRWLILPLAEIWFIEQVTGPARSYLAQKPGLSKVPIRPGGQANALNRNTIAYSP